MIDITNNKIKEVLEEIHENMQRKMRRVNNNSEKILLESRICEELINDVSLEPRDYARILNDKYGYSFTSQDIIYLFRSMYISNPAEREILINWAIDVADAFSKAITGDRLFFDKYENLRNNCPIKRTLYVKEKIGLLCIYNKCPEIDTYNEYTNLLTFGNILARYFFFDLSDSIASVYDFPQYKDTKRKSKFMGKKMTYDELLKKTLRLENALERSNFMLQDLQDEFDVQLESSKVQEQIEFFSKLNSERYGFILDELLNVRKGVQDMKKAGLVPPIELNGILIMVKKLVQFVRDSHIDPIKKVGNIEVLTPTELESCDYKGTPIVGNESKNVQVISPGWIYKDKSIPISRPKVEETEE